MMHITYMQTHFSYMSDTVYSTVHSNLAWSLEVPITRPGKMTGGREPLWQVLILNNKTVYI